MYGDVSSSSDEDDMKLPKETYNERSPLVNNKTTSKSVTAVQNQVTAESGEPRTNGRKWTQYLGAIVATIGGFIMGTAVGWTSPAGPMMIASNLVTTENVSWIAALMPLGALLSCPVMATVIDKFGRKQLMIIVTIPALVGWALIIWAQSVLWIYGGRLFIGFASGSYSVIVPQYTSEIAEKQIRGSLGSYFQLQVNFGILFTYVMGSVFQVFGLSVACAIVPLVYIICLVVLLPESPMFYLMKGNTEKARASLEFFRGPNNGTVSRELDDMQKSLAKTERERVPIVEAFQTTPAKRGLFLGLGIMFFQQFTGCNAVIFYATTIFSKTGSKIEPNTSTIVIGVVAVVFTYVSTLVVDRLGRRILLLYSIVIMGICTFFIGGFFYAKSFKYDVSSIGFVPLMSLCIFIVVFSIGFGPIPWMMMGEIFPIQIKGTASSIVCMSNWIFVFLVTKFFTSLVSAIQIYNTFWLFTMFSVLGTFFVGFIVPETKGKTMEEIQELLGANISSPISEETGEN